MKPLEVFIILQQRLLADLSGARRAVPHGGLTGSASEENWLQMLRAHLPDRYRADSAMVVDSNGVWSGQIDVVIYDRQYTPRLYNRDSTLVIPAEGVYAVFEVKQELNKHHIEYAGQKAASVRRLERTSAPITHAGGNFGPRPPFPILAGVLTHECSWSPVFGEPIAQALAGRAADERLDLGCAVARGSFEVDYSKAEEPEIDQHEGETSLVWFFLRLLARLQGLGTVTAMDYSKYILPLERG